MAFCGVGGDFVSLCGYAGILHGSIRAETWWVLEFLGHDGMWKVYGIDDRWEGSGGYVHMVWSAGVLGSAYTII
jgi:hypothetical protein